MSTVTTSARRGRSGKLLASAMAGLVLLAATPASAAVATVNPILYQPAVFRGDLLTLSTARTGGELGFTVAFGAHYTDSPLSFAATDAYGRTFTEQTVRSRVMGELLLGFTALDLIEVGVAMPLVLEGQGAAYRYSGAGDTAGFQVGELRASVKSLLYRDAVYGVAVVGEMTVPTADEAAVVGNGLGGGGRIVNDFYAGPMTITLNTGVYARAEPVKLNSLEIDHEMMLGLGGEVDIYGGLAVLGEAYVRTPLMNPFGDDNATSMEAIGALRWSHDSGVSMTVGGGGGTPLFAGYGTSKFRVFGDIRYSFTAMADRDGDGVADVDDACSTLPEDMDGFQDADGCPDPDNDEDGFLDQLDQCPMEAEDFDQFDDEDGCRDWDNDRDGVRDDDDRCRNDAEDLDGYQDEDGCPDLDNDGDGVPDSEDECPFQRESPNGYLDEDGCPDYEGIQQADEQIHLDGAVRFDADTHVLLPESHKILRAAARYIIDRPELKRVRIDVHTSKRGKAEKVAADSKLVEASVVRAQNILEFMVIEGLQPRRLVVRAVGGAEPAVDTGAKANISLNERVRLFVIDQD
jgi:outer membrane protein OmpA-like peptidoglycan-associated protein